HHLAPLLVWIGVELVELLIYLMLQIARKGADPDGTRVLLGPHARRRHITECFADAGSRFGNRELGRIDAIPRGERMRHSRGIFALLRARLGSRAQQSKETRIGFGHLHRNVAGRRFGAALGPFGKGAPYVEAGESARSTTRMHCNTE